MANLLLVEVAYGLLVEGAAPAFGSGFTGALVASPSIASHWAAVLW